ncbi:hypothetical protein PGIGA_G00106320 [Pangasianodon gigas]|uniref:Uncharacterized protein n=1 Tax=Pangasianodon gigas TaxID=30993 RepID=A0ACC5W918_PANGG|nr:hypothetical protein [Pangasianodon gigas]
MLFIRLRMYLHCGHSISQTDVGRMRERVCECVHSLTMCDGIWISFGYFSLFCKYVNVKLQAFLHDIKVIGAANNSVITFHYSGITFNILCIYATRLT